MDIQYVEKSLVCKIKDDQNRLINLEIYFSGSSWKAWLQGQGIIACEFNLNDVFTKVNQWIGNGRFPSQTIKFDDLNEVSQESLSVYNQEMNSAYIKLTGEYPN